MEYDGGTYSLMLFAALIPMICGNKDQIWARTSLHYLDMSVLVLKDFNQGLKFAQCSLELLCSNHWGGISRLVRATVYSALWLGLYFFLSLCGRRKLHTALTWFVTRSSSSGDWPLALRWWVAPRPAKVRMGSKVLISCTGDDCGDHRFCAEDEDKWWRNTWRMDMWKAFQKVLQAHILYGLDASWVVGYHNLWHVYPAVSAWHGRRFSNYQNQDLPDLRCLMIWYCQGRSRKLLYIQEACRIMGRGNLSYSFICVSFRS